LIQVEKSLIKFYEAFFVLGEYPNGKAFLKMLFVVLKYL